VELGVELLDVEEHAAGIRQLAKPLTSLGDLLKQDTANKQAGTNL
jgi:hypothetical protein